MRLLHRLAWGALALAASFYTAVSVSHIIIEWGPGVYGAEAAAAYHFSVPAARLTREQSARLAAVLPSPLRRKPARMDRYSAAIQERMRRMGW